MDQNFNSNQNEFLWTLLANPADDARLHAYNLRRLVDEFPQSGVLQALMARASDDKNLKQASAYFDAKSLFKLINAPLAFAAVTDEKIIKLNGAPANGNEQKKKGSDIVDANEELAIPEQHIDTDPRISGTYFDEHSAVEIDPSKPLHTAINPPETEPEVTYQANGDHVNETLVSETTTHTVDEEPVENIIAEDHAVTPISTDADQESKVASADDVKEQTELSICHDAVETGGPSVIPVPDAEAEEHPEGKIEKEPSDETIDIKDKPADLENNQSAGVDQQEAEEQAAATAKEAGGDKYILPELNDEEDKLIVGNIAATDFFMFDRAFGENKDTDNRFSVSQPTTAKKQLPSSPGEHHDVSKYNDEKMPYTFMWWLDKTRKEHAGIHQPYVKPETSGSLVKQKHATDELQQQYFENIFHITSVDELDKHTAPKVFNFGMKRKEQVIIERFIKEEPQIKPQSSDKLDNENKAKKSSEDRDELVTETLAGIYTDQMLYHKAIASYKKLMLKYPEKSRYFASKIEQLEKKTN